MPLDQFAGELIGGFPGLDILVARNLVNKAWQDIRDEGLWSWLSADGPLAVPGVVTAGSVSVVQGVATATGDATAAAVWLTIALANPPLASPNLGQGRQLRLGQGNPIYNIIAFDGVNTITLDRAYGEVTASGQTYQIYRLYYAPPSSDFLRYLAITNVSFAYSITGKFLNFNQEQLDRMDPQRGSFGDAYINAAYKTAADGTPVYELWPAPTNANSYIGYYQRRGLPLTPPGVTPMVDIPATLSTSLIMARAEYWAAQWARKNVNRYRDLAGVNWQAVRKDALDQYHDELLKARRQDFEIFKQTWIAPKGQYLGFPVDAAFMQSHDVDVMFNGFGG
jgi:hypothetical protein